MTRDQPPVRGLVVGLLLLAGPLCACTDTGQAVSVPAASATVQMAPEATPVDLTQLDPGEDYAPFLTWGDRDTLTVTTLGSSTPTCWPRVESSSMEQDHVLRLVLDYDQKALAQGCNADLVLQEWTVPVPGDLGSEGIIRLVWDTDPGIVYEYPRGDSRPW